MVDSGRCRCHVSAEPGGGGSRRIPRRLVKKNDQRDLCVYGGMEGCGCVCVPRKPHKTFPRCRSFVCLLGPTMPCCVNGAKRGNGPTPLFAGCMLHCYLVRICIHTYKNLSLLPCRQIDRTMKIFRPPRTHHASAPHSHAHVRRFLPTANIVPLRRSSLWGHQHGLRSGRRSIMNNFGYAHPRPFILWKARSDRPPVVLAVINMPSNFLVLLQLIP